MGPVGSGKSSAAAWEVCYYIPWYLLQEHGIRESRVVVVRNTYVELIDTTQRTYFEWFPWGGTSGAGARNYVLDYGPDGPRVEILFRSCDRAEDIKKFKSLEITGYHVDESIEVPAPIKMMLKNRIGRFPRKSPVRYGVETTNPPDMESDTYMEFDWGDTPPMGPVREDESHVLEKHRGFWQKPRENEHNLPPGYYDDLIKFYANNEEWVRVYINGMPGLIIDGKPVYNFFRRDIHVSPIALSWNGGPLYVGWDTSGNVPAAVVGQMPTAMMFQVLKEFCSDRMNIVQFAEWVIAEINLAFPQSKLVHWADPASWATYSTREGNFTSNAQLMIEKGILVQASEQNLQARISSVDTQLSRIDGILIDPGCTRLINGFLGGYMYPKKAGPQDIFGDHIVKNKYSHVHDALQYVMVQCYGVRTEKETRKDLRGPRPDRYKKFDPFSPLEKKKPAPVRPMRSRPRSY